jgi:hypothetical protein
MKGTSTATILAPAPAVADAEARGAVEALRRRLAGTTAREHVVLDFLEDDLRETRAALAAVGAYLDALEGALSRETPTAERLLGLARAVEPVDRADALQNGLASVRRRLSQVAARM